MKFETATQHLLIPYRRMDPYSLHRNQGPYNPVHTVRIRTVYTISSKLGSDFEEVNWHGFQESFVLGKER